MIRDNDNLNKMKDDNMDKKPKEVTSSILDAFDLLKSPVVDMKVVGGVKIIGRLQEENKSEKDVLYTLRRLIRSLGANIPDMRMGYFATLVNILTHFEDISVSSVLEIVKKELHTSGATKSEVGDVSLGQILVYGAIFRSGRMLKCTSEEQKEIVGLLVAASNKKSYLSSVAYLTLLDLINGLNEDQFFTIIWQTLKQDFKKGIKEHSLDSLYFLLMVNSKFPQKVKLRKLVGVTEILHEDLIPDICEKLMSGIDFNSSNHPIYTEIGKAVANSPHLLLFWEKIDSFLVKHNRNRELAALNMLNTILLNIKDNVEVLPDLISENFLKLSIDWFKGLQTASKIRNKRDQEDDHKMMIRKEKEVLISLSKALNLKSVDSKIRLSIVKKLLLYPGEINFTEITGSTIIKSIIAGLDEDGLKKLAKILKKVLLNISKKKIKEDVERNWYNNERVKAAELISYIVSHEAIKDDTDFKISHMQLLMCFGFFKIGGDENIAVSNDLSGAIKTCFYRCFTSRFSNVDNLLTVLTSLSDFISKIMEKEQVQSKLEKQFSTENMECWKLHKEVCDKIENGGAKSKVDKVFLILLHQLGLFLFSEPTHVKMAQSSIAELKSCYDHYKKEKNKREKSMNVCLSSDEPEWVEVMVEVLLSILSIDSSVLRSVVQCVFRLLWEYLTPSSIGQIVSVLDPDSETNPLNNDSESEIEEDGDKSSITEEDIENNTVVEEESDDSDSEIESDEDNLNTPDQLRLAVQKALGSAVAPDTDTESLDADMIDEEEGQKLDDALAEAFKQFHQGKNKKTKKDRKNKKALSDFRIRVLDLIDIYLEKDPAMDICLSMIAPLTRSLESCMQDNQFNELENKIRKTFKNLVKTKKFSSTGEITMEILTDFLKATIDKHNRSRFMYQALGDVITYSASFIVHCSQKVMSECANSLKKQKESPITDVLKEALENYFQSRNCSLPIIFFHKILQIEWEGNYHLMIIIINNTFNKSTRQFRRNEGLELITGFFRSLNRNKPSSKKDLTSILKVEESIYDSFNEAFVSPSEFEVKPNFLKTLKKLINIIKMYHENTKINTKMDFKSMFEILNSVKGVTKVQNKTLDNVQQKSKLSKAGKRKKDKTIKVNGKDGVPLKKSKIMP